jgi:hypothetical protein
MKRNTETRTSITRKDQSRAIMKIAEARLGASGISLAGILSKMPNWALIPSMVGLFGLLVTDTMIVDPLPFVDEAAMLWALLSGMRVLLARRKAAKEAEALDGDELEALELRVLEQEAIDVEAVDIDLDFDRPAPGQPLRPARQRI